MKAEVITSANDLMANTKKRVNPVLGIEVEDIFYFRMEMCVVGLHALPMAGIDSMIDRTNTISKAVVSSGGYDDDDVMVYTGQGGNGRKEEKRGDQKLERGNYAMEQSDIWKNLIRVIRSQKDPFSPSNKVYIYDRLYRIKCSWTKTSKLGFKTFKHKLMRVRGQPDGFAVVNEVDNDPEPDNFLYVTTIGNEQTMRVKDEVLAGCKCRKLCIPGSADCYCMSENGGWLPYSLSGLLVKRLPLLYDCGSGCECMID